MGNEIRKQRLCKGSKGFTLLEVTISMAVLAISLLGIVAMQISAVRNVTMGNIYSKANALANQHVERLRNTTDMILLDGWGIDPGTTTAPRIDVNLDETGSSPGIFTQVTRITNPFNKPLSRKISVTIQWTRMGATHGAVQRSVTAETMTMQGGL